MKVSSAFKEVIPTNDIYLVGCTNEERKLPAIGIHDNPLCVSLMLEIKGVKLLFVSVDFCVISEDKISIIKDSVISKTDIKKENIVINSVHTHSGPNGLDSTYISPGENPEYFEIVKNAIVSLAIETSNNLEKAVAKFASVKVEGFYNNRSNQSKPIDNEAILIKFVNEGNKTIGAICNFNCHSTVLSENNRYCSSDLMGKVRGNMEEFFGILPYTFPGAAADVSNRNYRQGDDFNELERVGNGISDILKSAKNFKTINLESLELKTLDYRIQYDNTLYFDDYRENLDSISKLLETDLTKDEYRLKKSEKAVLENKLKIENVEYIVKCKIFKLNELTIIIFPGELASKFGLQLKRQSKNKCTIIIGYSDDYQGYFIEEEEYGHCYETVATKTLKGESEKLVNKLGELL